MLAEPMTVDKLARLEAAASEISDISGRGVLVCHDMKIGPVKPLPDHDVTVFVHLLPHTVQSYRESPLTLVKNSWQYECRLLVGRPLGEIESISRIDRDLVLRGALGIEHCLALLEERRNEYIGWTSQSESSELVTEQAAMGDLDAYDVLELALYSILRNASNALRWRLGRSYGIGIDIEDMLLFEKVFWEFGMASCPVHAWERKRRLREGLEVASDSGAESARSEAAEFLEGLGRFVASCPQGDDLLDTYVGGSLPTKA